MKFGTFTTAILCAISVSPALAQVRVNTHLGKTETFNRVNPHQMAMNHMDRTFMQNAYSANEFEALLGKLAQANGSDEWVKDFGQDMNREHSMANRELRQIAQKMRAMLSHNMPAKLSSTYNRLSRMHGAAFDRAFVEVNKKGHAQAIQLCANEVRKGNNANVRGYATTLMASAKMHQHNIMTRQTMLARDMYRNNGMAQRFKP